ncbi:VOC family protein [Actinoplanes sp. CA-142083]|uniref:VOC family protein n=1 Tax=Actinoplanes sp. CA-142083 TaxID=3239903 RepID=UPI003D8B692C
MDLRLEVETIAVRDVDRALAFYRDRLGFRLDVDYQPHDGFRIVQLTPPGSSCSLQFGVGFGETRYLVVEDIALARQQLIDNGVLVGTIRHKASADWQGDLVDGVDPDRRDYASFADFQDPDGHRWTLQERGFKVGE